MIVRPRFRSATDDSASSTVGMRTAANQVPLSLDHELERMQRQELIENVLAFSRGEITDDEMTKRADEIRQRWRRISR